MLSSFDFKNRIYDRKSFESIWKLYSTSNYNVSLFKFMFLLIEDETTLKNDEIIQWCVDNITGYWCFNPYDIGFDFCYYYFKDDNDAMAFKLFTGLDLK